MASVSSQHTINTMSSSSTTNPSICIPRTFSNITWQLVKDAFDEIFGQGFVERVDVVNKTDRSGRELRKSLSTSIVGLIPSTHKESSRLLSMARPSRLYTNFHGTGSV